MAQEQQTRTPFTSGLIGGQKTLDVEEFKKPSIEEVFEASEKIDGTVRCVHGANEQNLPIQGKTVGWVRANLAAALNIAPAATALIDGEKVGEDTILAQGKTLEFLKEAGRKGRLK